MPVTTTSFDGRAFPTDVAREIINTGLTAAVFWSSLTARTTNRASLAFATGDLSGFNWTGELGALPDVDPGDDAVVVAPHKLGGKLLLSNEAINDTEMNLTREVARLIAESMAAKADRDFLYGVDGGTPNPAAPTGVVAGLDVVEKPTLRSAVVNASAEILAAGGTPDVVLLSPALWAVEQDRREATSAGSGIVDDLGVKLDVKVCPALKPGDGLVFDRAGAFAVTRKDFKIEASSETDEAWSRDGFSLRVIARLAAVIPVPARSARALAVDATP